MAYDLTIHERTIRREGLRQSDFYDDQCLMNPAKMQDLIVKTKRVSENGFERIKLSNASINGRETYKIKTLEHEIVLRVISKNIKQLTRVRQNNRLTIVRSLQKLLEEGLDYKVYKSDIKSFYENVDVFDVLDQLDRDAAFSRSALKSLKSFFSCIQKQEVHGLPRGIALSATLAEYVMRKFDCSIQNHPSVFFYSRFVDDIIIITSPNTDTKRFFKDLRQMLPSGLHLNPHKTGMASLLELPLKENDPDLLKDEVDFLGYRFSVNHRKRNKKSRTVSRVVRCDISPSKVKKIKTRIIRSFLQFTKDQNFDDLLDRLKLLSGNYTVYDHGRGVKRKAGIYFNYSAADGSNSIALVELDRFLKGVVLSKNGKMSALLQTNMSSRERRMLLKISFHKGFCEKVFYNFQGSRIVDLMKCWRYG